MNEFIEKYKSFPNSDLLKIIENPGDYQEEAVEAAQIELERRELSGRDWQNARLVLEAEKRQQQRKRQNRAELEQGIGNFGSAILDRINPIQKEKPTAEKIIRFVTFLFVVWSVYGLATSTWQIKFLFETLFTDEFDFSFMLSILPVIGIPIGTILFALRKKVGWILLNVFLGFTGLTMIVHAIMILEMQLSYSSSSFQLFQPPHLSAGQIVMPFVIAVTIWTFCRKDIREKFNISKGWMINSFVYAILVTLMFLVMVV